MAASIRGICSAMNFSATMLLAFLLLLSTNLVTEGQLDDSLEDSFDIRGPYALHMEFKLEIGPGVKECFYQVLKAGTQMHLSFEVLRGADRNIDVVIKNRHEAVVKEFQWTSESSWNEIIQTTGVHSICIDNGLSRFTSKLVYVYMLGYIPDEYYKFQEETDQYIGGIENFTTYVRTVSDNINTMRQSQAHGFNKNYGDIHRMRNTRSYVQYLSIAMSVLIVTCSAFQVYFVRRLFRSSGGGGVASVSGLFKPRA